VGGRLAEVLGKWYTVPGDFKEDDDDDDDDDEKSDQTF